MKNRRESGFILITVYWLLTLLVIFAAAGVTYALADLRASQRLQANLQAFYLAEAGVDWAIAQFRDNPLWAGGTGNLPAGSYTVTLATNPPLGGNRQRITSQGTAAQGIQADRQVESIIRVTPNPLFLYALFSDTKLKMKGNSTTDSYNSSQGPYRAGTAGSAGDIGTNSVARGKMKLNGNVAVHGNAKVGPGGDPSRVISLRGRATITGTSSAAQNSFPNTPVSIPPTLTNRGNLRISGNDTLTLPGGIYWYENIQVTGNGQLTFAGPAVLYVSDKIKVRGKGIGSAGNLPPNLIIYVGGEDQDNDDKVQLGGDAEVFAGIFAPDAKVKINGHAALYGAIVGRDTKVNIKEGEQEGDDDTDQDDGGAAGIHYDEAFRRPGGGSGSQVQMMSWREQ